MWGRAEIIEFISTNASMTKYASILGEGKTYLCFYVGAVLSSETRS
jgi:hypothetical protein